MKSFAYTITLFGAIYAVSAAATSTEFVRFTSDERGTPMAHVVVHMENVFPGTSSDLAGFDLDVGYTNYNKTLFEKISSDLSNATSSYECKVAAIISALHGKEFEYGTHPEADEDYHRLSDITHPHALKSRNSPYWTWSDSYVISLPICDNYFNCITGVQCPFYVTIDKAPRSRCETQDGQNCCLSWSSYNVVASFFPTAWTTCYDLRSADNMSCQAHDNDSGEGGDICFSSKNNNCT